MEHNAKEIRVDVQPGPSGSIVILVTGELKVCINTARRAGYRMGGGRIQSLIVCDCLQVDDSPHPLPFSQAFQLSQDVAGQWFVVNDLFRLNV